MQSLSDSAPVTPQNRARRGLIFDIGINLGAPLLIWHLFAGTLGETGALLASMVPPLVWCLAGLVRQRRFDPVSLVVLGGAAVALIATLAGGSGAFIVLRDKLVTGSVGLAFAVSALIGRPLVWPLAREAMARQSPQALARFDALREAGALDGAIRLMTWVWGLGLMGEVAVSVLLYRAVPLSDYLVAGPLVGYGAIGALAGWTALYHRRLPRDRHR